VNYRADQVFQAAAAVARKGWKVVRLYGVRDDATCTCHLREKCDTPGKHPSGGGDWQSRATDDEEKIVEWFNFQQVDDNQDIRVNVGVRLGRESGIIDVEVDSPEAEETIRKYGLDRIDTPTYRASRGCHRIFRFEDDLPDVAVVKVENLEVRIGGGGKAAQSVMPCSWHRTGIQYLWLPGKSPEEVEPAPLPAEFKEAIRANSRAGGSGVMAQAVAAIRDGFDVAVGGRHAFLLGSATWLCRNLRRHTVEDHQTVWQVMRALNLALPQPKEEREVAAIVDHQFRYFAQAAERARLDRERPYERYGLAWDDINHEWDVGDWSILIIHSDPIEYRLSLPVDGREVTVSLNHLQICKAIDVAAAILCATGKCDLLVPSPAVWKLAWDGGRVRQGDGWRDVIGLRQKLLIAAEEEQPSLDACLWSQHAAILLAYLRQFSRSDDEDEQPCGDGTPRWICRDGRWELWLKWQETVRSAWRNLKTPITVEQERVLKRKILEITGEADFRELVWKRGPDKLGRFKVLDDRHLEALDRLTGA